MDGIGAHLAGVPLALLGGVLVIVVPSTLGIVGLPLIAVGTFLLGYSVVAES